MMPLPHAQPASQPAATRRPAWPLILFALLAVALVARASRKEGGVLVRNRAFGERFLEREDPYFDPARGHLIHGPYPPSLVWIAAPLAVLPEKGARIAWALAQVAALAGCAALFARRARALDPSAAGRIPWAFGAGLLLTSRYVLRDTAGGGGNLMFASLAFAGLELALSGRGKLAGLPIGLGLVCKPNLAPLLVFFAICGRWRTVATATVTAVVLFALPGLWYGPSAWTELSTRWVQDVVAYSALEDLHDPNLVPEGMPRPENGMNQSLREAVFRTLRPPGETGAADVRWFDASAVTASLIARGFSLLLLALAVARCLGLRRQSDPYAEWLTGLSFFALALLLSPISWKAHAAALLPLASALAFVALSERVSRKSRILLAAVLGVYYVACNLASEELLGKDSKHWLQSASIVTWGTLALFTLALWLSTQRASQASYASNE